LIGARVVDGVYTLADDEREIKMPPSLTLSKVRSLKQQALIGGIGSGLKISTTALACIYFERLCLDCRVDKKNRRLSFAACLLLAFKNNEPHVAIAPDRKVVGSGMLSSLIGPTKKSSNNFASLLEFFAQKWNITLKALFAAEWAVFVVRFFCDPSFLLLNSLIQILLH